MKPHSFRQTAISICLLLLLAVISQNEAIAHPNTTSAHENAASADLNRSANTADVSDNEIAIQPKAQLTTDRLNDYARHSAIFAKLYPQEKAWLHFDNAGYFQGDTIWFKAYVKSTRINNPMPISKVLYVDLVSPSGRVIHTRKLKIENGACFGDIPLRQTEKIDSAGNSDLMAGFYEIRAYTRQQLNFDAATLFSRVFPVYDKPGFAGDYEQIMTPAKEALPQIRPEREKGEKMNVEFYPEGGHLIKGLPCCVAYRVTDEFGCPIDAIGTIIAGNDDITTQTVHDGMGMFVFTPTDDTKIKMEFHRPESPNKTKKFSLPIAEPSGYILSVDSRHPLRIMLKIIASADEQRRTLGFTIQNQGNVLAYDTLTISGGEALARAIPTQDLPEGICQITLFDTTGIIADRLVFVEHPSARDWDIQITPSMASAVDDKNDMQTFSLYPDSLYKLTISTRDSSGTISPANLSVAVRDAGAEFAIVNNEDPRIDALLCSEMKGYISQPGYYFESNDRKHKQALDLLLMIQGWRRYDWNIMSGREEMKFPNFIEPGLVMNGYVFNSSGRKPIAHENVHIKMYDPTSTRILTGDCMTDSIGNFNFLFDDFYGTWRLSMQVDEKRKRVRELQYRLDRDLSPKLRAYAQEEVLIPLAEANKHREQRSLDEIQTLPEVKVLIEKHRNEGIHLVLDVDKENSLLADRGILCHDVEDFLSGMKLGFYRTIEMVNDSNTREQIFLWGDNAILNGPDPAMTSSGGVRAYVANNPYWALEVPIGEIKEIEICDTRYMNGLRKSTGELSDTIIAQILGINLYDLDPITADSVRYATSKSRYAYIKIKAKPKNEQLKAPKNFRITQYDGYYQPLSFQADYSKQKPDDEDFRRTLLWVPNLSTSEENNCVLFKNNSQKHGIIITVAGWLENQHALRMKSFMLNPNK